MTLEKDRTIKKLKEKIRENGENVDGSDDRVTVYSFSKEGKDVIMTEYSIPERYLANPTEYKLGSEFIEVLNKGKDFICRLLLEFFPRG